MEKLQREVFEKFEQYGQEQIFRFWDELNDDERLGLCRQAKRMDIGRLAEIVAVLLEREQDPKESSGPRISFSPASYISLPLDETTRCRWEDAYNLGEQILSEGRVAVFTAAGGQGTRLGFEGPKGTFAVTPVKGKSLFQVFAEKIRFAEKRYGNPIHWFIMTSDRNHNETIEFFGKNSSFGLFNVHFIKQGSLAAVTVDGKIMLEDKWHIAMHPDGHGGAFRAFVTSGANAMLAAQDVDVVSYFQIDNPLVPVIDPYFIGFHRKNQSQMSSRMILKAYPEEKVGIFCSIYGRSAVVEYSALPMERAIERDCSGVLRFKAGNAGIHLFDRDFFSLLGTEMNGRQLPLHVAKKKIPTIDISGKPVDPEIPNGIKFETFIFDALQFAERSIIVEGNRKEIFSPIKNSIGLDSPETCRQDQVRLFSKWLVAAGSDMPIDAKGLPPFNIEISPLFADNERDFLMKWGHWEKCPAISSGSYIE
ncbi:MAG: UTP--glucose-1-phosphate uridylyltransferase [Puniceicoccales bacterium]|jgi:UDP-N-acetylglucosamine/UDP-N-acetylgalactosamine diphosphorylase|nr:UTP--glucose-1-phosphate uridylyltransferase [Puniceicoccales bacterium]